jgi:hypothetical protein
MPTNYSAEDAAKLLNVSIDELKALAMEGKVREFRDGGDIVYSAADIDKLASSGGGGGGGDDMIVLEPADDAGPTDESGIELAPSMGSDVLSLEEVDSDDTASHRSPQQAKEGSVVSSVGVSVFDDDELEEAVDPMAQTQVTDAGGLGLEGVGSGSGILDLTRERDDTSLGAELFEDIYNEGQEEGGVEMGEDTRAGLEDAAPGSTEDAEEELGVPEAAAPVAGRTVTRRVVEYGPDPGGTALTALLVVSVLMMLVAGLAATSMVQGVFPSLLGTINEQLMIVGGGALVLGILASVITYFLARKAG